MGEFSRFWPCIALVMMVLIVSLIVYAIIIDNPTIVEGEVTDIESYVVKSGFGTSTEWAIELDNTTIIKADSSTNPFRIEIGDYIIVKLPISGMYAIDIEIIQGVED